MAPFSIILVGEFCVTIYSGDCALRQVGLLHRPEIAPADDEPQVWGQGPVSEAGALGPQFGEEVLLYSRVDYCVQFSSLYHICLRLVPDSGGEPLSARSRWGL